MVQKTAFSSNDLSADLSEKAKFDLWQEIHLSEIWSVEYGRAEGLPFEAEIEATSLGPLVIGQMAGTIKRATRKARNIADDVNDSYLLLINKADTALTGVQVGREYVVGRGEAALVTASESLVMHGADRNVWMNVVIPRDVLTQAFPQIDTRLAVKIDPDNEALDLLKRYCRLLETGPALANADLEAHAATTIVDLVGLVTGARGETVELAGLRGLRAARLQAVLAKIADGYANPGISAQGVARELKLSVRYVHDLLQETGSSFAERVLELRLQRTWRMLQDRHCGAMRISEIALICGFNDIAYFNRCFRRRFGCTPSDAR